MFVSTFIYSLELWIFPKQAFAYFIIINKKEGSLSLAKAKIMPEVNIEIPDNNSK